MMYDDGIHDIGWVVTAYNTLSVAGPVLDRSGRLIGLLSRSHESIKCSCVQPLRDLLLRVKGLLLLSSCGARTSASS